MIQIDGSNKNSFSTKLLLALVQAFTDAIRRIYTYVFSKKDAIENIPAEFKRIRTKVSTP
jgi:hypothetical protein